MKLTPRLIHLAAAGLLVLATSPLTAFVIIDLKPGDSFTTQVVFSPQQPAAFTGGTRIAPGTYDVHIVAMGDGSVRASFFDKTGRKAGEERGKMQCNEPCAHHRLLLAQQSNAGGGTLAQAQVAGGTQKARTFSSFGLGPGSPTKFEVQGNKVNLQIGAPGSNQILIGLQLPAIQKQLPYIEKKGGTAQQAPAEQKVR